MVKKPIAQPLEALVQLHRPFLFSPETAAPVMGQMPVLVLQTVMPWCYPFLDCSVMLCFCYRQ